MVTANDRIMIVTEGQEGGFMISALTGQVLYDGPNDCTPEWAPTGLSAAILNERRTWYETRIGKGQMSLLGDGSILDLKDLKWYAIDSDTMEDVEIEADVQWRSEKLASLLGLTPEGQTLEENISAFDKGFATGKGDIEIEVANSYEAHPTDRDLLEHDDKVFADGEAEKRAHKEQQHG